MAIISKYKNEYRTRMKSLINCRFDHKKCIVEFDSFSVLIRVYLFMIFLFFLLNLNISFQQIQNDCSALASILNLSDASFSIHTVELFLKVSVSKGALRKSFLQNKNQLISVINKAL